MQHRRLVTNRNCPWCGRDVEIVDYLFREYPISVEVWSELGLPNILNRVEMDFKQWLTWVCNDCLLQQRCLFCTTLWAIWSDRNVRIHEWKICTGKDIIRFINQYYIEIDASERRKLTQGYTVAKWKGPFRSVIKINFDCAFDRMSLRLETEIVAWNADRHLLLSHLVIHVRVLSRFFAEALACIRALSTGIERGWLEITVEGDTLARIKKC